MLDAAQITGVVLAGGRGMRMGGVDKGLQLYRGIPLAQHALRRLQPQVGHCLLNANRHQDLYAVFGVPVLGDELPDHAGPLAGFVTALRRCTTPWLVTVPCDSPLFPEDLVARLAAAACGRFDIAMAVAPEPDSAGASVLRIQPVFSLLHRRVLPSLEAYLAQGGRKIDTWAVRQSTTRVVFDDPRAFVNANTLAELQALQPGPGDRPEQGPTPGT